MERVSSPGQVRTPVQWKKLLGVGSVRWGDAALWRAARVALGVVVPLVIGWASGHAEYGAYAALGALPAGFASFQGETLKRVVAVVVASMGMAVSTFVGAVCAATAPWLLVPIVAVWAYLAGLAVCLGPRVSVAVLQWSIALLIAVGLPFGPADAALRAALVLAGGLLQAALVAGAWTLRPGTREREALAQSYRALAAYASGLAAGRFEPPPPSSFPASTLVDDPNPLLPWPVRLTLADLLEEAERIRAALAALAAQAIDDRASQAEQVRRLSAEAAATLDLIAGALDAGRAERAGRVRDLSQQVAQLTVPSQARWRWAGETLLGQLREVARIVANLDAVRAQPATNGAGIALSSNRGQGVVAWGVAQLRANISTTSEAGRHALRLAMITTLAEVMVQATRLHQGRWVVLTIFLVLRPDYSSTLYRGVQRAVGTMLGAGLGAAAAELARFGQGGLVAAAGFSIAVAYALFDVSYLVFSIFITAFIVVLLELLGIPAIPTAEARLLDTLIGSAMALVAYFAWPTWEGATAQDRFARLLEAHGEYATALLRELAHPGSFDPTRLRAIQSAARRARSDAEAATVRLSDEPAHAPLTPGVARTLIAAVARLAHAELALHALALSRPGPAGRTDGLGDIAARVDALSAALGATISHLALALRTSQPPQPIPALRPIHAELRSELALLHPAVVAVTDRLVDAANTLDAILRDALAPQPPAGSPR